MRYARAMLAHQPAKVVSVALANRCACIVWAVMQGVEWEDPEKLRRVSARSLDRDRFRELHQGHRKRAPHQRAGPMTGPDRSVKRNEKASLAGAVDILVLHAMSF